MLKNIDRIKADLDMDMFMCLSSMFGDGEKYVKRLEAKRGEIVTIEHGQDGYDKSGMERFKGLIGR